MESLKKNFRINYDTSDKVNQIFEISAMFEQDIWEVFYNKVKTETTVTVKWIEEI